MLSALVDKEVVAEAMTLGADDYVVKPCAPDELRMKLQSAPGQRLGSQGTSDLYKNETGYRDITGHLIGPSERFTEHQRPCLDDIDSRGGTDLPGHLLGGDVSSRISPVGCPSCACENPPRAFLQLMWLAHGCCVSELR